MAIGLARVARSLAGGLSEGEQRARALDLPIGFLDPGQSRLAPDPH